MKGDAKLWKELSLVCITFYYLPTTLILFNPIHELTPNNESTLGVMKRFKNVKMGTMTIMIRAIRDSRNK